VMLAPHHLPPSALLLHLASLLLWELQPHQETLQTLTATTIVVLALPTPASPSPSPPSAMFILHHQTDPLRFRSCDWVATEPN
jgi:hypothetical protein